MKFASTLLAACGIAVSALAQELPKDVERIDGYTISWDEPAYPAAAKALFAQGEVEVRQDFRNGKPDGEALLFKSSKSPILDEKALDLVRKARLQSEGSEEKPDLKKYVVKISFGRDSITNISKKTCGELLQDVGYHKATHGGQPVTQMRLYTMTLGMFYLSSKGGPAIAAKLNQALPRAFEKTVDICGKQPDAMYLEQLGEALKAAP